MSDMRSGKNAILFLLLLLVLTIGVCLSTEEAVKVDLSHRNNHKKSTTPLYRGLAEAYLMLRRK